MFSPFCTVRISLLGLFNIPVALPMPFIWGHSSCRVYLGTEVLPWKIEAAIKIKLLLTVTGKPLSSSLHYVAWNPREKVANQNEKAKTTAASLCLDKVADGNCGNAALYIQSKQTLLYIWGENLCSYLWQNEERNVSVLGTALSLSGTLPQCMAGEVMGSGGMWWEMRCERWSLAPSHFCWNNHTCHQ